MRAFLLQAVFQGKFDGVDDRFDSASCVYPVLKG